MPEGMEFSVTPQELIQKAEEMKEAINSMEGAYDDLSTLVTATSGYWIGEGGESCRGMFLDRREDVEEMLARMREHPDKLLKIAGIYREGEEKIKNANAVLPYDFLDG